MPRVASEQELDIWEAPLHRMVAEHLANRAGVSDSTYFMFFTTGYAHFAWHALKFVPDEADMILLTADLTEEERQYIGQTGRDAIHLPHHIDPNTALELIAQNVKEDFVWVDADCFVNDPAVWEALTTTGTPRHSNTAPFVYRPLGLAKTPLVRWHRRALDLLKESGTTLASYVQAPADYGRESAYAISRRLRPDQLRRVSQVLNLTSEYPFGNHEGVLDVYANGLTLHTTEREKAADLFGADTTRVGTYFESTVLANLVLCSYGLSTNLILNLAHQVSTQLIHPGGATYRGKLTSGQAHGFASRWRLTDLIEPLLLSEFLRSGAPSSYADSLDRQLRHLADGGIPEQEIMPRLSEELTRRGVDFSELLHDHRWAALVGG